MSTSILSQNATPKSCYQQRIVYGARIFGTTLRLFGIVLLVVQLVQAAISITSGGSGVSVNIAIGCTVAITLIVLSKRQTIHKAVAKFANSICDSQSTRKRSSIYIYIFPFIVSALVLWAKVQIGPTSDEWRYVSSEGSVSEYGTAVAYLLVPIFAYPMAKLFRRQNRRLMSSLYFLLIAGAFFIGMEEISWGQRLLGYQEPEFWTKHNVQSEFTFHNFAFFQNHLLHNSFILIGFLGSVCWIARRYWQSRQGQARSSAKVNPLTSLETLSTPSAAPPKLDPSYLLPDWPISSFFYPTFIFYTLITYTAYGKSGVFLHSADQEHWEFVMSLGILLFVVISFFRQANESANESNLQNEPSGTTSR